MVLLAGGALLAHSFWNLEKQNLGMNARNVVTVAISLGQTSYPTAESQMAFFSGSNAIFGMGPVLKPSRSATRCRRGGYHRDQVYASLRVEGRAAPITGTGGTVASRRVTPEYFHALQITMVEGQGFTMRNSHRAIPL